MLRLKHSLGISSFLLLFFLCSQFSSAAYVLDSDNGLYTDDFADATGLYSTANAGVNGGLVQLRNAGGNYTAPYVTGGFVVTNVIMPRSVAKWGTLSFTANTPANTLVRVQVLDSVGNTYTDNDLPGNEDGFTSSPIDISSLSPLKVADVSGTTGAKKLRLQFRILFATADTSITPTFDNLSFSWTPTQGDLTASAFSSSSPWPSPSVTAQGTYHSPYYNTSVYPAIKWATDKQTTYPSSVDTYIYNNQLIGTASNLFQSKDRLYSINRDTGAIVWDVPYLISTNGAISENGTLYTADIWYDIAIATDLNDGSTKWSYQFSNGHGNSHASLGNNGISYTIRSGADQLFTIYAFEPDGDLLWAHTEDPPNSLGATKTSIGPNGSIYLGTTTWDGSYQPLNQGKLYAFNPEDGSLDWSYDTGDLRTQPLVDADGTIYVGTNGDAAADIKLYAINPDGSLKWQKSIGQCNSNCDYLRGYFSLSLRSDGVLLGVRLEEIDGNYNSITRIDAIDTTDGSTIWSEPSYSWEVALTAGDNGYISSDTIPGATSHDWSTGVNRFDTNNDLTWRLSYPYNDLDGTNNVMQSFNALSQDERGWLYGGFDMFYRDSNYNLIPSENFVQFFALAPWTLSATVSDSTPEAGDTITFTARSSMPQANPLLGGNNAMQVMLDNSDVVALTYSSTDGDDSVWTGSYTVPSNSAEGTYSYAVEAAQTYLQTDIDTHFTSAPTESSNTGITTTGSFDVVIDQPIDDDDDTPIDDGDTPPDGTENVDDEVNIGSNATPTNRSSNNRSRRLSMAANRDTSDVATSTRESNVDRTANNNQASDTDNQSITTEVKTKSWYSSWWFKIGLPAFLLLPLLFLFFRRHTDENEESSKKT